MAFPPKSAKKNAPIKNGENPAVSTGKGGLPASLKVKAAGLKPTPGLDKNVNQF